MKLCFLAGANSIHSYRWIKYLADKGYTIHWISLAPMTDCGGEIKNLKLYLTPCPIEKWQFGLSSLLKLLFNVIWAGRLIKKIKPDILHSHYAGVNGLVGALSGFHPFVLTAWGSDILIAPKSKIVRPLIKFALNKADLITCNGEPLKDEMMRLGVSPQKIRFVYWGIDTKKFKPGYPSKDLRNKLGTLDRPTVISLRNLEPVYDIETLIAAAPLVLKEIPQAKFIIAGEGSQECNLKKLAQSLNVLECVRFVGWIPHDELPQYLSSSDIYVSTSLSDGDLSQSTGQAMACEVPIITTDLEVNKKRIKDGENGLLVPCKNPQALAQKIIFLLKNKNMRLKLGENGRKTIEATLNFSQEMGKAEKLYQEIIKIKT